MRWKKTDPKIRNEAEEVLRGHNAWRLPVDPLAIAEEEGIYLSPGTFSGRFDGRIKYLPDVGVFSLAYREPGPGRPQGRVNFTVAHELGHYFLHGDYLRSGKSHGSESNFRSQDRMEREADEFAVHLLMPFELFKVEFASSVAGLDLPDLVRLSERLGTSVTSTILRVCNAGTQVMTAVFSEDGRVRWACASPEMEEAGMSFVRPGSRVPPGSVTHGASGPAEGAVEPYCWFDRSSYDGELWEECMPLGRGRFVTCLSPVENL